VKSRSQSCRGFQPGFTLVELLLAVAIVGLLTTVGIPSLSDFLKNSGLKSTAYELMSAMTVARSEAVKRGTTVILCRSADPHASTPTCGGTARDWSDGWLVFVSTDGDADYDAGADILVAVGDGRRYGIALRTNSTADATLVYRADGSTANTTTAQFVLCDMRGTAYGKQLNVTRVGRPDLTSATHDAPLSTCSPS